MTRLAATFLDNVGNRHILQYKIYDTVLAKKWLDVIRENQKDTNKYIHTSLYNATGKDIPSIYQDLEDTILKINKEYDMLLPLYDMSVIGRKQLNKLHDLFENYGDRIPELESIRKHTKTLNLNFLNLNELIHKYEIALTNKSPHRFPYMAATMDYWPQTIFRNIEPLDKLSIQSHYEWGQLFLGYNTLGKDWLTACSDNDTDIIVRGAVRPQKRFAAESWFCFGSSNNTKFSEIINFERWYNLLPTNLKPKVPVENLSELVLGKFLVGEIIINEYFLHYDPEPTNWLLPKSEAKKKWNTDVFSTFTQIEKIRISL